MLLGRPLYFFLVILEIHAVQGVGLPGAVANVACLESQAVRPPLLRLPHTAKTVSDCLRRDGNRKQSARCGHSRDYDFLKQAIALVGVVVNHCFTSLFGTKDLLGDIVIQKKRIQLMR